MVLLGREVAVMSSKENVCFDIVFDNPNKKTKSRISERLLSNKDYRISAEKIQIKQEQADKRRQAQKDAKLARMKERQQQCKQIAMKMEVLLELDAKRKGIPGTESVPAVSKRQAAAIIRSVAEGFKEIGISLTNDVSITDS